MTYLDRCPTHPRYEYDSCPFCEREIARRELDEQDDDPGEADREAERYEGWLRDLLP